MDTPSLPSIVLFSDTHLLGSPAAIAEAFPYHQFIGLGDLNARNDTYTGSLLSGNRTWEHDVFARVESQTGLKGKELLNYVVDNHTRELFSQLHAEAKYTQLSQHELARLGDQGKIIGRIPDTGGNSDMKYSNLLDRLNARYGIHVDTPLDHLKTSRALRQQKNVEYQTIGNTLFVTMPYTESSKEQQLFTKSLTGIIKEIERSQPKKIVFGTHEHIDPGHFFSDDSRLIEMEGIIKQYLSALKSAAPDTDIALVAGHLHKFAEPYALEEGITVYTIGWNQKDTMRVVVVDPETGELQFKDITVEKSQEELDATEDIIQGESKKRGFLAKIGSKAESDESEGEDSAEEESEEAA